MNHAFLFLIMSVISTITVSQFYLSTCARMDVFLLDKAARAACITSCSIQNCGTGYCKNRSGRKTCVCYRCANGGNVPLDSLVGRKGK
uniref:Uncharacterized protein n=1 Tax=Haemonchus contortus TaxID=6289 RepID=A0A7I4XU46_HAECO